MVALTAPAQDMRRAPKGAAYSIPTPCRAPRSTKLNRAASCCLEVGTGPLSYKPSSPEAIWSSNKYGAPILKISAFRARMFSPANQRKGQDDGADFRGSPPRGI